MTPFRFTDHAYETRHPNLLCLTDHGNRIDSPGMLINKKNPTIHRMVGFHLDKWRRQHHIMRRLTAT